MTDLDAEYRRLCHAVRPDGRCCTDWLTSQGAVVEHSYKGGSWRRVTYVGPHPVLRDWHYVLRDGTPLIEPTPDYLLRPTGQNYKR